MIEMSGIVEMGEQLGRQWGFPTANLQVPRGNEVRNGVYAAWLVLDNGDVHPGAASLGLRPTVVENGERLLEVHVLDAESWLELYDEHVTVQLVKFIRPEERFESVDDLVTQIAADC